MGNTCDRLSRLVTLIVDDPRVTAFYLGRARSPRRRGAAHGSWVTLPLIFWEGARLAVAVEGAVLKEVGQHPKCRNRARHGGGGVSPAPARTFIYLCLWG
jgi:hypothetical protein